METVKLSNGVEMPLLGFGVYLIPPEDTERCVKDALKAGYRMIDTAQAYKNEESVGKAIAESGIPRKEIFIVTKVWISNYGYEETKASLERSLKRLQTDYIDLVLLHQPYCDVYGAYRALEEYYTAGKLRAIGVSNFYPGRLLDICANVKIPPMVNQVETHVFNQRVVDREIMKELKVVPMAWGPYAEGKNGFFTNETLVAIGKKYGKSAAQVALRYMMDLGIVVIPKSVHKERIEENFNVFDFKLTDEDKAAIAKIDKGEPVILQNHYTPEATRLILSVKDKLADK